MISCVQRLYVSRNYSSYYSNIIPPLTLLVSLLGICSLWLPKLTLKGTVTYPLHPRTWLPQLTIHHPSREGMSSKLLAKADLSAPFSHPTLLPLPGRPTMSQYFTPL